MPASSIEPEDANLVLPRLAAIIESRLPQHGGDPDASYVARLLHRGPDAFLKKIGEEATEVVMAAKDLDHALLGESQVEIAKGQLVGEMADLWFHCMVALAHYGLRPADVLAELHRREGTSGIEEKALRKVIAREGA
ncbi:MAG: phosphoribosyl-ATP diphosphatase [Burkholderiaceae bacterium]